MKTRSLVFAALILAIATLATAAESPFVGTWKWNSGKSKFVGSVPYKAHIAKIEAQENGIKIVDDYTSLEGKPLRILYDCKYDGKDYPLTGDVERGSTYAMKKIDANTVDGIWKLNGKISQTGRWVISKDGKTMTGAIQQKNAQGQDVPTTIVFDKQ